MISEYVGTIMIPGPNGKVEYTGPLEDRGSFVVVSPSHVLTNWHVVSEYVAQRQLGEEVELNVYFSNGNVQPAEVIKVDPLVDLALLQFNLPAGEGVHRVGIARQFQPTILTLAGYRQRMDYTEETATSYKPFDRNWFTFPVIAIDGQSGAPILDQDGKLCGLLWGSDYPVQALAYCVRLHAIREFLADTEILELRGN